MYWWNNEHNIAVVEICKNASSSFAVNFRHWERLENQSFWQKNADIKEIIVVFRDPYERFLSALNQFMSIRHWSDESGFNPLDRFPWFHPDFDNHTGLFSTTDHHFLPQKDDIQLRLYEKFPEKYTFFWMDGDIVLDVQTYLWNKYKITPPRYGRIHNNKGGFKIIKEVNRKYIENTYKADYEFFEKLTKEDRWENK